MKKTDPPSRWSAPGRALTIALNVLFEFARGPHRQDLQFDSQDLGGGPHRLQISQEADSPDSEHGDVGKLG